MKINLPLIKKQFYSNTGLKVQHIFLRYGTVNIQFEKQQLDCNELALISKFIIDFYSRVGYFTHTLPKLQMISSERGDGYSLGIQISEYCFKDSF